MAWLVTYECGSVYATLTVDAVTRDEALTIAASQVGELAIVSVSEESRKVGKPRHFPPDEKQTTVQCLQRDKETMKRLSRLIAWGEIDRAIALLEQMKSDIASQRK